MSHSPLEELGFLSDMADSREMKLEQLVVPEVKEQLKQWWPCAKTPQEPLEG